MPTIHTSYRSPSASISARDRFSSKNLRRSLLAFLLIAALGFPIVLVQSPGAKAVSHGSLPAPISAPPQVFNTESGAETPLLTTESWRLSSPPVLGGVAAASADGVVRTGWFSTFRGLKDAVATAAGSSVPAGFEAARVPTLLERLASHVELIVGMIAPSRLARLPSFV